MNTAIALQAILIDTETTRKDSKPGEPPIEVIELYWEDADEQGAKFASHYKPVHPIQNGAAVVHNIIMSDLEDEPPSARAPSDLPAAEYWIAHNVDFDWRALGELPGVKRICTLALARELWPEADSHSLGALMYHIYGQKAEVREWLEDAHAAESDVRLLKRLLQAILRKAGYPRSWHELYALSEEARIPKIWPFGKFEGQPISAADRGYAGWFTRTCIDRPDYGYYMAALRRAGLVR